MEAEMQISKILLGTLIDFPKSDSTKAEEKAFTTWFQSDVPAAISNLIKRSDLRVKASAGSGNRAEVPWIGIFNPMVSDSAMRGYYVVYLFALELNSVFLCQGQGVTQIEKEFKRGFRAEILRRGALMRSRVPEYSSTFEDGPINLRGRGDLAKKYEAAPAWAKEYKLGSMPEEMVLEADLREAITLYDCLFERGGADDLETAMSSEEVVPDTVDEQRKLIMHRKVERNAKISKKVKKLKGFVCESCGFDFGEIYGERGQGYIEAHHLLPLAELEEGAFRSLDLKEDFAVLCANCHRMAHRTKEVMTLEQLRALPGVKRLRSILDE